MTKRGIAVLLALLCLPAPTGRAQLLPAAKETRRVLVLFTQEKGHPAHDMTEQGILEVFRADPTFDETLYIEYLDLGRFSDPSQAAELAGFLRKKYQGTRIDVIIAVYPSAVDFVLGDGDNVFPGVPIVACEVTGAYVEKLERSASRRYVTGISVGENAGDVLETALRMRPGTIRVALVGGVAPTDRYAEQVARKGLEPYAGRLETIDLTKLPMGETLARLASLPSDAVVFYASIFRDGAGRSFVPREALKLVSRAASVPVFGLYDTYMGYGIVGGRLASFAALGRAGAALALRILSGESPGAIPFVAEGAYVELFDWRELVRWKIPETLLPSGSSVLYREPSLWLDHRWAVVGFFAVLALQSILIAALVIHRTRRRSAERALRQQKDELALVNRRLESEQSGLKHIQGALQASREKYRWLAGNLLMFMEKERRRVARELHDDISQRLAALSMEAAKLDRESGDTRGVFGEKLKGIGKDLIQLSGDVHFLSRQLHPSILDDLGLSESMRAECARFSRQEGIEVSYEPENVPGDLSGETKLCLYRVLQEGLRNVAKHAEATGVRVRLAGDDGVLRFELEDNGKGFSPAGVRGDSGLGLISMKERIHLVRGEFRLESKPGEGTAIRIVIPAGSARGGR